MTIDQSEWAKFKLISKSFKTEALALGYTAFVVNFCYYGSIYAFSQLFADEAGAVSIPGVIILDELMGIKKIEI